MRGIDAHCHVFVDDEVPPTTSVRAAAYTPPQVSVEHHADHLASMDCDRGVLVQPSAYGSDHRCLLAALDKRPHHLRGVVCAPLGTPLAELEQMHAVGVRGTRLQDGFPGGVPVQALVEVGEMVAPLGWHLEVWTDLRRHVDWFGEAVRRCPVPVVLDHMGYVPSDAGIDDPAVRLMLDLLAEDQVWVTLSGLERLFPEPVGQPGPTSSAPRSAGWDGAWQRHEVAVAERVRAFAETRADNLLWGSDWPHVGLEMAAPLAEETIGRLERWLPDEGLRRQVLVDNAVRRYDFTLDGDQE